MIYFIWIFWLLQVITFPVWLLNFLIAVISQSYEGTMMRSELLYYSQKAALNLEIQIHMELFGPPYRSLYRLRHFLSKSREESKSALCEVPLLVLYLICSFVYWLLHYVYSLVLSPALVEELVQGATRMIKTGNRGFCGLIVAY